MIKMSTYFRVEEAIQTRHCHICGDEIQSGEHHGVFCSNSFYSKNICKKCMKEKLEEIRELDDKDEGLEKY